jgi:hypothetical protein
MKQNLCNGQKFPNSISIASHNGNSLHINIEKIIVHELSFISWITSFFKALLVYIKIKPE